jgi:hypothetical protein
MPSGPPYVFLGQDCLIIIIIIIIIIIGGAVLSP